MYVLGPLSQSEIWMSDMDVVYLWNLFIQHAFDVSFLNHSHLSHPPLPPPSRLFHRILSSDQTPSFVIWG